MTQKEQYLDNIFKMFKLLYGDYRSGHNSKIIMNSMCDVCKMSLLLYTYLLTYPSAEAI